MPRNRRASVTRTYRQAQLTARQSAGRLGTRAIRGVAETVNRYADRLVVAIQRGSAGHVVETLRLMRSASEELARLLERTVGAHRTASYEEVATAWRQASLARLRVEKLTEQALVSLVRDPPLTLLSAYESLGGAAGTWRTLIRGYVRGAAQEADHIVRTALLEGVSPVELGRRLRPYVTGAEPFHRAFGGLEGVSLRQLEDPVYRRAAGTLVHNADRIAFTEVHNARAEAEGTAFAADPFVAACAWRLAPDRGEQTLPDECDVFATEDFFGLGSGVYPVDQIPTPPHPWDRCERVPVTRGVAQAGEPKPLPQRERSGAQARIPQLRLLSKDEAEALRQRVEDNLTQAARVGAPLRHLAAQAVI